MRARWTRPSLLVNPKHSRRHARAERNPAVAPSLLAGHPLLPLRGSGASNQVGGEGRQRRVLFKKDYCCTLQATVPPS